MLVVAVLLLSACGKLDMKLEKTNGEAVITEIALGEERMAKDNKTVLGSLDGVTIPNVVGMDEWGAEKLLKDDLGFYISTSCVFHSGDRANIVREQRAGKFDYNDGTSSSYIYLTLNC